MLLRDCPPMLRKKPPTRILPSACTTIESDSRNPGAYRRVRVERISQASRGIEPCDAVARLSANNAEIAAR